MKPLFVALTVGDWNGIGPEVVLRSIQRPDTRRQCVPVLVGPAEVFETTARRLGFRLHCVPFPARPGGNDVGLIEPPSQSPIRLRPGILSASAGAAAGAALETAAALALADASMPWSLRRCPSVPSTWLDTDFPARRKCCSALTARLTSR